MNLSVAPTQFTEGEALELTDYQPLNRFAILSAILGGLSLFALLHPLLLALPLFGAAAGFFAYWQLTTSSVQSGRAGAKWGIFLSLLFGTCALTTNISHDQLLANQARTYAIQWFELLRAGKLQEAHQLVLHQGRRAAQGVTLAKFYESKPREIPKTDDADPRQMQEMVEPTGLELFEQFYARPAIDRLTKLGPTARYKYLRTISVNQTTSTDLVVTQQYEVTSERGDIDPFVIEIPLERTEINKIANWRVDEAIREVPIDE